MNYYLVILFFGHFYFYSIYAYVHNYYIDILLFKPFYLQLISNKILSAQ